MTSGGEYGHTRIRELLDFSKSPNMQSYMTHLVPRLKLTHDIIQQNLREGQEKSKQRYDQSAEEPELQVGEKVMMQDPTAKTGECPKLKKRWKGPFMVVERSTDGLSYVTRFHKMRLNIKKSKY